MSDPPLNLIASSVATSNSESLGRVLSDKFGGTFTLGIRPHNISLQSSGAQDIGISGKVRISEITGSSTYLHLDLENAQKIVLELDGAQNFTSGTNMTVFLDRSAVYGFDPKSGATLFAPAAVR
jgi:glycerol transport system ATP-binding protein